MDTPDLISAQSFGRFAQSHTTSVAIFLFSVLFVLIQIIKPSFLYNRDGSLRVFGIGTKNKTVIPMWLVAILLGITSYFVVIAYT